MSVNQSMTGSPVYSQDGDQLGTVKEVRGQYFKVDAPMQRDYWLRTDAVQSDGGRLVVAGDVQRYDTPDDAGTELRETTASSTAAGTMSTAATREYDQGRVQDTHAHATEGHTDRRARPERETDQSVELREERLRVEKQPEQAGAVRLGKQVTEHTETVDVPVREERVVVERTPGGGQPAGREIGRDDQTIEVPVERERVNVEKEAVVAEEVNVRKEATERTEQVQETVRKEELEVDDQTGRVSRKT